MSREELIAALRTLMDDRANQGRRITPHGGVERPRRTSSDDRFLLRASDELASTLDCELLMQRITRLAVSRLGDWCLMAVDPAEDGNVFSRLEVASADPAQVGYADRLRELLVEQASPGLVGVDEILARRSVLVSGSRAEVLANVGSRERLQELLGAIDPRSVMVVPLLAGETVMGAMTFLASAARPPFDENDLALAEELARRTAAALERARLYRKAQDAVAVRDEVLGYVAHDIRNPLSAVAIAISLLARRPPGVENDRRRPIPIDNIVHALKRMNRIVDDLLDVTRLDCGALALQLDGSAPKALVRGVMAELAPVAITRGITLTASIADDLPPVRCDVTRIEQVIANLIGNALKFTPHGGRVTVGAEVIGSGMVRFSVADTGQGMTPEEMVHVFDRFWQAKATSRGTAGLGLAICRGIVAAHGGEIWVDSQPDAGSTFYFTLPAAAVGAAVGAAASSAAESSMTTAMLRREPPRGVRSA